MVTIVMKSGYVFRDVELSGANKTLMHIGVKRTDVSGDELLKMMNGGEVYSFRETTGRQDEWTVSIDPKNVEGVK